MATPASSAEFIDLVRKSGVLDEKRLDTHLDKLRAASTLPNEAGKMAGVLVRDGFLTHFQAEQIMLGKWRRFTIGKYKVLERLGSGGMGSVYLCEHKLMRRRVAVKVLPTAKAADPSALERFYREARAVAALDHPNIVHAYDIDQDENLHFLVMEYVDGASLQEIVKRGGPLSLARVAHYINDAAFGLHHAHLSGLVHRDIKPGNVLVDRTGVVKILDMGLARFFNDEEDILTKKYDENVLGTADYLAPEQALDSHGVDIRADIYSLGATFYFCLTGRTPFSEGTVAQKLIWHQTRQPKPIRSIRADVPEGLVAIIDKMMAKDPAQRYQTPLEVAEALHPWIETPIGPPPEAEMPRLSLAATGVVPGEATSVGLSPSGAPSPSPRKNWQVPATAVGTKPPSKSPDARPKAGPATVPAGAGTAPAATASPAQPAAAPRPNGQPAGDEESIPWEQMTSDTDAPSARIDTAPRSGRKAGSSSRARLASKSGTHTIRDRRRQFLVLGVVCVAGVAGLIFLWIKLSAPSATTPSRPPLKVNAGESIQKVLARARPGDRIVVAGGTYDGPIKLKGKRGITIEAGEGEVVIVIPPVGHNPNDPLLNLVDTKGDVAIKHLRFDGLGKVRFLATITLVNPGLTLDSLTFEKFAEGAIEIANARGNSGQPIQLLHLTTIPQDAANPKPAVVFKIHPSIPAVKINNHIHFKDCDFRGHTKANPAIKYDLKDLGDDVKLPGDR